MKSVVPPGPERQKLSDILAFDPLISYTKLQREYGSIVRLDANSYAFFDIHHIKTILTNKAFVHSGEFMKRRLSAAKVGQWRAFRQEIGGHFARSRALECEKDIDSILDESLAPGRTDVLNAMERITSGMMVSYLFGEKNEKLAASVRKLLSLQRTRHGSAFPLPMWLPTPNNVKLKQAKHKLRDEISKALPSSELHDLSLRYGAEASGLIVSVLSGGTRPPATVLSWIWFLLDNHRNHEHALRRALADSDGDQTRADAYTEAVCKEAIRLYTPNSVLARIVATPYEVGGYHFKPGMKMIIPLYTLHRNPDYWEEPDAFIPERWFKKGGKKAYIPFGMGASACMAAQLAMTMLTSVVSRIVPRYELRQTEGSDPSPRTSGSLAPNRLIMRCEARYRVSS